MPLHLHNEDAELIQFRKTRVLRKGCTKIWKAVQNCAKVFFDLKARMCVWGDGDACAVGEDHICLTAMTQEVCKKLS